MIFWLSVVLISFALTLLTVIVPNATFQAIISSFSALISGVAFVINYGRDISYRYFEHVIEKFLSMSISSAQVYRGLLQRRPWMIMVERIFHNSFPKEMFIHLITAETGIESSDWKWTLDISLS